MLKRLIVLSSLVCFFSTINAQEYYVLQVKGKVKNKSGSYLKSNDIIKADEKLSFSSPEDVVAVVNPKTGRSIIKPAPSKASSELFAYVKDAITPATKKLSTRNGGFNNVVDLQAYFKEPVLLLPVLKYQMNANVFPLSSSSFFFIRYKYNNEDINKKVVFHSDTIRFIKEDLLKVDGQKIEHEKISDIRLYYLKDNKPELVSPLHFNFTSSEQLQSEVLLLKKTLKGKDQKETRDEMIAYLSEFYGKIDSENFNAWFEKLPQ
jgi:hypothetical protein